MQQKPLLFEQLQPIKVKTPQGWIKCYGKPLQKKLAAVKSLNSDNTYVAKPVRRVYIPKANSSKLRPLGIPSMHDRAMQTLWNFALVPIAECTRDIHSYGFRKGRSTADRMQFLWLLCSKKYHPKWVLEADIKGFFDNIHQ